MGVRAGIVVTGTEVLTGHVRDANGPWLAQQLLALGVDVGQIVTVGDRPEDMAAALAYLSPTHDLLITTGGLGPTADDLTAEVVAQHQGSRLVFDEALAARISVIIERLVRSRGWTTLPAHLADGTRKQAMVPIGAHVLEPTGTAPGLVVPAATTGPPVLVLPGPPGELQAMWPTALAAPPIVALLESTDGLSESTIRAWGPLESELAALLRDHEQQHDVSGLEITTCLRDGELEISTRYSPTAIEKYRTLERMLLDHFGDQVFSSDGRDLDQVVADQLLSANATVATAESCTAGLLAGRLADLAGSSAYLVGGMVTYANEAKNTLADVPEELLAEHGAVSEEVAIAMAQGARRRLGTTYGISTTGVAGPGGGSAEKPVGLVHISIASEARTWHRRLQLPGDRAAVRQRTVVFALHLLRKASVTPA